MGVVREFPEGRTMTHQPKGGMCCNCQHARRDCSALPFKQMKPIERDGDRVIVRCTGFERKPQEIV